MGEMRNNLESIRRIDSTTFSSLYSFSSREYRLPPKVFQDKKSGDYPASLYLEFLQIHL